MSNSALADTPRVRPDAADPMDAARLFALALHDGHLLERTWRVKCELRGDLARGLDGAVMLGLEGEESDGVDAASAVRRLRRIHDTRELRLLGTRRIAFDKRHHLVVLRGGSAPSTSNGMRLSAFDPAGTLLLERSYEVSRRDFAFTRA